MLAALRRAWRAHLDGQATLATELAGLRAGQARLLERLASVEAVLARSPAARDQANLLAALVAADNRHADPASLARHHAQLYSQNGEDGMVAAIFARIGARDRFFVEVGIGDGSENNTRLLLEQGWRGVWVEADPACATAAAWRMQDAVAAGRLSVLTAHATPDGLDAVLDDAGVPDRFDFLSLDIDQHTTHVWRALKRRCRVACVEYNAAVPASAALEVPYDPARAWDGTNWFGGGLKTLELIGAGRAMHLVGCDLLGCNAFFVDAAETEGRFRAPFTAEAHHQPPLFGAIAHLGHPAPDEGRVWQAAPEA